MSYPFLVGGRAASRPSPYGRVRVIVPPPVGAITQLEAVRHLNENAEDVDTEELDAIIREATEHVETIAQHALIQRTLRYTVPAFPNSGALALAWAPFLDLVTVTYRDASDTEQTLDPAIYRIRNDSDRLPGALILKPNMAWPATADVEDAVSIDYRVGYTTTLTDEAGRPIINGTVDDYGRVRAPADLKAAVKLIAGDLYEHREAQNEQQQLFVNAAVAALMAQYEVPRI